MPTKVETRTGYTWKNVSLYGRPPECQYIPCLVSKTTIVKNAVSRRPKPVDLLRNQTSLPTQSTLIYTYFHNHFHQWPTVNPTKGYHSFGDQGGGGIVGLLQKPDLPTIPSNLYVNELRNQIKDVQGVNIAEDCFEFRQTADLFGDLAKSVARAYKHYRALRRGDVGTALKTARRPLTVASISKAHLAAAWGVAPLVSTLQESISELNVQLLKDSIYWKRFVARSTWETSKEWSTTLDFRYHVRQTERAVVWAKFRPNGVKQVQFGNPLELGWNLLTLSCIADWFIPIGEALSALDALTGVEEVKGTVTTKLLTRRASRYPPGVFESGGYTTLKLPVSWQEEIYRAHSRVLLNSIPSATLPRWNPSESWRKLGLAVSVLVGIRAGGRPLPPISKKQARRIAREAARHQR